MKKQNFFYNAIIVFIAFFIPCVSHGAQQGIARVLSLQQGLSYQNTREALRDEPVYGNTQSTRNALAEEPMYINAPPQELRVSMSGLYEYENQLELPGAVNNEQVQLKRGWNPYLEALEQAQEEILRENSTGCLEHQAQPNHYLLEEQDSGNSSAHSSPVSITHQRRFLHMQRFMVLDNSVVYQVSTLQGLNGQHYDVPMDSCDSFTEETNARNFVHFSFSSVASSKNQFCTPRTPMTPPRLDVTDTNSRTHSLVTLRPTLPPKPAGGLVLAPASQLSGRQPAFKRTKEEEKLGKAATGVQARQKLSWGARFLNLFRRHHRD